MYTAFLFGGIRLQQGEQRIEITRGRERTLFAYLLLHPTVPHTREKLIELLWPEQWSERSNRNFNNVLYRLQQNVGKGWWKAETESITLAPSAAGQVDVWEFARLCADGDPPALERAVTLYAGDSAATAPTLAPELYDDWLIPFRTQYHEFYLNALQRLATTAEHDQQLELAQRYYQRLLLSDNLHEEACAGLMRTFAQTGRPAEALTVYARLVDNLERELDLAPSPALCALAEMLRVRSLSNSPREETAQRVIPFVGRVPEKAQLLAALDQAQGPQKRGGIVVILGEAGSGKTRLLAEISKVAGRRGWQIYTAYGKELTLPAPYAPLHEVLAAALPKPRLQQLQTLVQPIWLQVLASIAPPLAEALGPPLAAIGVATIDHLTRATQRVLQGLQQIAPHLLILDDVHWADPALWSLLQQLQPLLSELSILIVVAARLTELRVQSPAWQLVEAWETVGAPVIALSALHTAELRDLAAACGYTYFSATQLADLSIESGGNPLIALSLLTQMSHNGTRPFATGVDPIGDKLQNVFAHRLHQLSPPARQALQAAAILGFRFQYQPLTVLYPAASAMPLPVALGELEQAHLIYLEGEGYRFDHDTLRAYLYATLTPEQRCALHTHALQVLQQEQGPIDAPAMLYHAEQAQDRAAIARWAYAAGLQAYQSGSMQAAARYFEHAATHCPTPCQSQRFWIFVWRVLTLNVLGDRGVHRACLSELVTIAEQIGDPAYLAEAAVQQAIYYLSSSQLATAHTWAERGLAYAQAAADPGKVAYALEMLFRIAARQEQYAEALTLIQQARKIYAERTDRQGDANALYIWGCVHRQLGDSPAADKALQEAADLCEALNDVAGLNIVRLEGARLQLDRAEWQAARQLATQELARARTIGFGEGEILATLIIGQSEAALGNPLAAIDILDKARVGAQRAEDWLTVADTLAALAVAYGLVDDWATVEQQIQTLATLLAGPLVEIPARRLRAGISTMTSRLAQQRNCLSQAFEGFHEARVLAAALSDWNSWLLRTADAVQVAVDMGHLGAAEKLLTEAFDQMTATPSLPSAAQALQLAAYYFYKTQAQTQPTTITANCAHALRCLGQAETLLATQANTLSGEERTRFLQQIPLNTATVAAISRESCYLEQLLLRADALHSQPPTRQDYRCITWTLYAPSDELITKPSVRRRHVLQRLLDEAAAQGVTATDQDLADGLGVSLRTITRDRQQLASCACT